MPGNVTGVIGNQPVEFVDAATESTLAQLLKAVERINPNLVRIVDNIARNGGTQPDNGVQSLGPAANRAAAEVNTLANKHRVAVAVVQDLTQGIAHTSVRLAKLSDDVLAGTLSAGKFFSSLSELPMGLGVTADLFAKLAVVQQDSLQSYRKMTDSGINFGGNLDAIRLSASKSYLTLDEFTGLMKSNSTTFARLGGNVNDGAVAFSKISAAFVKSDVGRHLMTISGGSEEVNKGLARYLELTGARGAKEMANTAGIAQAAGEYMMQLDGLTKLTGISRETLEQQIKEGSKNAAWQRTLAEMGARDAGMQARAVAAYNAAMALGGKGIAEVAQAALMGIPPMTKMGQEAMALAPTAMEAVNNMIAIVNDSTKTTTDITKASYGITAGITKDMQGIATETMGAMTLGAGSLGGSFQTLGGIANKNEHMTKEIFDKTIASAQNKTEIDNSQAAQAVDTERSFKELSARITDGLLPVIRELTNRMNDLVKSFSHGIGEGLKNMFTNPVVLVPVSLSLLALVKAMRMRVAAAEASTTGGRLFHDSGLLSRMAKGGLVVAGASIAGDMIKDSVGEHSKLGATTDILQTALQAGGAGMMLGPWGAAAGALGGAAYGLYKNYGSLVGGPKSQTSTNSMPTPSKASDSSPTISASVSDQSTFSSVDGNMDKSAKDGIDKLTMLTHQMLQSLSRIAENTERTVNATKSLNGNLYAR